MNIDRRQFVTWSAGGALLLGLGINPAKAAADQLLNPWIRIGSNGKVTLYSTVSEMGQGSRTGQARVLADELDVSWDAVNIELAPFSADAPFNRLGTGGSSSIRAHWDDLRKAGATARAQLVSAAAERWNCAEADCRVDLGMVTHSKSGEALSYGDLAVDAAACAPPAQPPLKPASDWRYIGKAVSTLENTTKSRGEAKYGIDVRLPGMLFASIAAAPVYGATLVSLDEAPAMAIPGVIKVVKQDNFVAVVAKSTWVAFKGVRALKPQWSTPDLTTNSADLEAKLDAALADPAAATKDAAGRAALRAAIDQAPRKVEATYQTAYLAHAALEPMNTTVQVSADKVEVWSPTQVPTAARAVVAQALGRPVDQVVLHNTLLGGGFGRRLMVDYAKQAALIAAQTDGAPVQLIWTREEDVSHDFYRRATRAKLRAGLRADGLIDGYEVLNAGADQVLNAADPKPYGFKGFALTQATVKTGIPQGPWRSVDEGLSAFGRESFIDECAHAAGMDPLAYRRKLVGDNPRVLRLLETAAKAIGWDKPKAAGVGRGLALTETFQTLVATGIEVQITGQALKVVKVVHAADLGVAVNPQQVKAQLEGGAVMGVSSALQEAMSFTGGKADQNNFKAYRLLRMRQAPNVEVFLFDSPNVHVGGAGEPGVPNIAPAIANAVFDASGKRVRTLPFASQGFTV